MEKKSLLILFSYLMNASCGADDLEIVTAIGKGIFVYVSNAVGHVNRFEIWAALNGILFDALCAFGYDNLFELVKERKRVLVHNLHGAQFYAFDTGGDEVGVNLVGGAISGTTIRF